MSPSRTPFRKKKRHVGDMTLLREQRGGGPRSAGAGSRITNGASRPRVPAGRAVLRSRVRSWKFYDVIPEIDIWRAATLMLNRYRGRSRKALRAPTSSRRPAMTTAWPSGSGSRMPSANSSTPPRPVRSTDPSPTKTGSWTGRGLARALAALVRDGEPRLAAGGRIWRQSLRQYSPRTAF
jgi:hypothetical protein